MYYINFNLSNSLGHLKSAKYIKCLGKGAYGTVKLYQCKDNISCNKLFVVKYIKYIFKNKDKDKDKDKLLRKRVLNEYTIGTLLHNEYIIKTLDIDLYKNAIIFEHCNGIDFLDYIQKMSPCFEKKIFYFKQVIDGLIYMHNIGIAHMDLKLENIIIDIVNNKIKIIDFGHSKVFHDSLHIDSFILKRKIYGSVPYIAPEEFLNIEYNPEKVDVWSCGIILYIIIYNNYPWNKADIKDLYYKKYLTTIKYNKYFFIKYNNLLNKLLNPDPSKRPQIKEINFEDLL